LRTVDEVSDEELANADFRGAHGLAFLGLHEDDGRGNVYARLTD
jgi:hypothetical protein